MIRKIDGRGRSLKEIREILSRPSQLEAEKELDQVLKIIKAVREKGDRALIDFTSKFDKIDIPSPDKMRVAKEEIQRAYDNTDKRLIQVLEKAAQRIEAYHSKQRQESWFSLDEQGVLLGQKISAMDRVGLYVPGGRAAYPSSVLMNAIPARVAGVKELVMVSPPKEDGKVYPSILAAAKIAGIDEIYTLGGAQAVAALAYGTETIPKVDKIVGPGNIYVALAKKQVYGQVDIDMIAGPSEIVVIADKTAEPAFIAADLMSQAEHDIMASAILITDSIDICNSIMQELERQVEKQPLRDTIKKSLLNYGACILVDSIEEAVILSNDLAPEHLELMVKDPMRLLGQIRHAGAIFLGPYTPEPVGDYMAGPNHVLPTSGTARFFSPLGVDDFVKKSSIVSYDKRALSKIYKDVADFARMEGLPAHANSVEVRFKVDD